MTDQELAEKAHQAILDAIDDLAHDRLGHTEILEDEVDGLDEDEADKLCGRFEAQVRKMREQIAVMKP